jgi:Acetyltransferase (GNAT) family
MQDRASAPHLQNASGRLFERRVARLPKPSNRGRGADRPPMASAPGPAAHRATTRFCYRVEYQIRPARITDISRLAALGWDAIADPGRGALDAADLLRQLVSLPNASVLIAESRRDLAGCALLVLRPSVTAGGYIGTIDFILVASAHDPDGVTIALLDELLRSAGNKGCSTVEVAEPTDPESHARLERAGFSLAGPVLRRPVAAAGTATRRI